MFYNYLLRWQHRSATTAGVTMRTIRAETQSVQKTCQELVSGPPPSKAAMKITFFIVYSLNIFDFRHCNKGLL